MAKSVYIDSATDDEAEIEAAIKECVAEIERAKEQMSKDQAEIELLKAETRTILAELKAA